ncbi:MAG: hydrogen gas-evolving membrane-bound hydrogenase subunit E [Burkholderiaceae bacterium]
MAFRPWLAAQGWPGLPGYCSPGITIPFRFFLEKSLPVGGGTNVVNVILVDFRGYGHLR